MKLIIVTICDSKTGIKEDIEVAADICVEQLLDDITQALMGYKPALYWELSNIELYSPRKSKSLTKDQSLLQQGIRNGDYLYIVSKQNDSNSLGNQKYKMERN